MSDKENTTRDEAQKTGPPQVSGPAGLAQGLIPFFPFPMPAADYDLTIPVHVFNMMVGIGWQLPGDAFVSLCVGPSCAFDLGEAHCGESVGELDDFSAQCQYLVVRAGPWEFYPEATLHHCKNYPGLRVRLRDLRAAWRSIVKIIPELEAMEAMGPGNGATDEQVMVRFDHSDVTIGFLRDEINLKGE